MVISGACQVIQFYLKTDITEDCKKIDCLQLKQFQKTSLLFYIKLYSLSNGISNIHQINTSITKFNLRCGVVPPVFDEHACTVITSLKMAACKFNMKMFAFLTWHLHAHFLTALKKGIALES